MRRFLTRVPRRLFRLDPIFRTFLLAAFTVFVVATWYFHDTFHSDLLTSSYFVLTTMTTTGYGDLVPDRSNPGDMVAAMALMVVGVSFTGIFIALMASRLTRAQWVQLQGLRRVHRRGHIVVCGAGSIGSGVIDLLLEFGRPLVVVEARPDPSLVERARDDGFDLLTGDASRDDTLGLCNLGAAHSLVALTNVDTLNLEIALGARARNPDLPIVLRIAEATFADSIAAHFDLKTTFSVAALAGPAFAGLSRIAGARGHVVFDQREFGIGELTDERPPVDEAVPLAVAHGDELVLIRSFDQVRPGERTLVLVPLAALRQAEEAFPVRVAGALPE